VPVTNLTIANILLTLALVCLAISGQIHSPLFFIYSMVAVTLAGAVRHQQLPHRGKPRR
jgi:mannose/fructose/N-acetylgalactosamine-specific phosphotransferase system component IID